MKNPETPSPKTSTRSYVPHVVDPLAPGDPREDKFLPRYVEVPALREHGFGRRNLAWGVTTLVVALAVLVAAVMVAGQKAVLSLAACLVTLTALFVLARLHIFRQRNGGFLAAAVVVLLGAIVPLIDRGYEKLAGISQPSTAVNQAAAPLPHPVDAEPPLLMQAFALGKPDPAQTQVRVLKDSRVLIGEKPFLIKTGDVFPLLEMKAGEATFAVRDLQVSLPVAVVEILGGKIAKETRESAMAAALVAVKNAETPKIAPASNSAKSGQEASTTGGTTPADLAVITRSAQLEAMRRYPALGVKDSMENELFITTYHQLKDSGNTEFFTNPEWPLELAELLATRNSWTRGDRPAPTEPSPVLDPPSDAGTPLLPPPANDTPLMPQDLPPTDVEPPQVPRTPRQ